MSVGVDEQGHADPCVAQAARVMRDMGPLSGHVEAAFGCNLGALFGHQAGRVRSMAQRNLQHLRRGRYLEVERQLDLFRQAFDILVRDVAAVFAQMRRNSVGPRLGGQPGRAHGIGMHTAAGVANGRHVIDVHAQPQVIRHHSFSVPCPAYTAPLRWRLSFMTFSRRRLRRRR